MGDGGSIFIGFALAWYLIMLSQGPKRGLQAGGRAVAHCHAAARHHVHHAAAHAPWQIPLAADREHLHHILMLAGFGANRTVLIILAVGRDLVCILIAVG